MDVVARAAGYTRTIIYRHFATRDELMDAVAQRYTAKQAEMIMQRLAEKPDAATKIVDALVVVGTELIHDPIYTMLGDETDDGTVATLLAKPLVPVVEAILLAQQNQGAEFLRKDLRPSRPPRKKPKRLGPTSADSLRRRMPPD
jgi:AcrR family transcriptional regulator